MGFIIKAVAGPLVAYVGRTGKAEGDPEQVAPFESSDEALVALRRMEARRAAGVMPPDRGRRHAHEQLAAQLQLSITQV